LGQQQILAVCNLSAEEAAFDLPKGRVLLGNYPAPADTLRPWEAYMLELEE